MENADISVLDRFLDPLARSLTPDAARSIMNFHVDQQTQTRIDELAAKSNEGQITIDQRQEYEAYVEAIDIVGFLQSKAREALEHNSRSCR